MSYEIEYNTQVEGLDLEDRSREIKHLLEANDCEVTFTKVDGTLRVMPCTLKASAIPLKPVELGSKSNEKRLKSLDVISVWCLDKNEWRAFKTANVKKVKIL